MKKYKLSLIAVFFAAFALRAAPSCAQGSSNEMIRESLDQSEGAGRDLQDNSFNMIREGNVDESESDLRIVFEMKDDTTIAHLEAQKIPLKDLMEIFQTKTGKKIITSQEASKDVSAYLKNIAAQDALRIILDLNNLAYAVEDGVTRVMLPHEFELKYGQSFAPSLKIETIKLSLGDGNYLAGILREMKGTTGTVFLNDRDNTILLRDTPENLSVMKAFVKEMDVPLKTEVFTLKKPLPEGALAKIQTILTQGLGKLELDTSVNTLTVTDKQSKINEVDHFLSGLNEEERIISVNAKIIQIVLNDEHPSGVDWEAIVTDYQNLAFEGFAYNDELNPSGNIRVGYVSNEDFTILLEALDTVGVIYNVSNSNFKIADLERMPFNVKSLDMATLGHEERMLQSEELILNIRPLIDQEKHIALEIAPQRKDQTIGDNEGKDQNIFARLPDDSTLVIGSLFKDITVESSWKIPLLGDIPILGFAFRNQGQTLKKSEIIVFLTPRLIQKEIK